MTEFDTIGDTDTIRITAMSEGDSCSYKIKSSRGSPAFKIDDSYTMSASNFEISYLEFDEAKTTVSYSSGEGAN